MAFGGVLLLVLLVSIPNVATATAHPATLHAPPFHGTQHVVSTVQKSGCGATASLVVLPKFNLTTGIGKESAKSAVTGCGPPGFSDTGSTEATVGFDSLVVIAGTPAPGNFSFSSRFNVSWNPSATPGNPFGGPFAWASAALVMRVWLYDPTNATAVSGLTFIDSLPTTNGTTTGNVSGFAGGPTIVNGTFLTVTGTFSCSSPRPGSGPTRRPGRARMRGRSSTRRPAATSCSSGAGRSTEIVGPPVRPRAPVGQRQPVGGPSGAGISQNSLPSGSRNRAMDPHGSSHGGSGNRTPRFARRR
ncbi:MAG: hypothetical protein L3K18_09205 [Thermoplasmata archaeon]|nr:hypothetical protein [Thermoplasmata archaeon]